MRAEESFIKADDGFENSKTVIIRSEILVILLI
jgi:hypothetical protein